MNYKVNHCQYGLLPPKNTQHSNSLDKFNVDMIGPCKIIINNFEFQFRAVTCIDVVIYLPEVIPVDNAKSRTVVNTFKEDWLKQYPSPRICMADYVLSRFSRWKRP